MQKHEITEYQKHALPYPRSRYRTYAPSDGSRDATYQAHVRCTAATNRGYRQEPRHCGGVRASMRTAGQRRAQGRTRKQQGESTAEWQQGSPSLERSLTTTDISAPRRSSQRPPCQCLLMSITAHTHICARRPQGECSQHERPTCRQTIRGTRLAKGLLQACRRDPLCCSLVLPHGKSGFTLFRLIAQEGRKQAFRLQLGSSACIHPKVPRNRNYSQKVKLRIYPWAAPIQPLQADRSQSSRLMVGELHENCGST